MKLREMLRIVRHGGIITRQPSKKITHHYDDDDDDDGKGIDCKI